MQDAIQKASVLIEALPYIRSFHDKVIVVKYGGSAMDQEELDKVLLSVAFMSQVGMRPVLVHGGGKFITQALKEQGVETRFVNGQRYTDEATLRVVEHVLADVVSGKLVDALRGMGSHAVALTTPDRRVLSAERMTVTAVDGPDQHGEDLGFVGRVTGADADTILEATVSQTIPVIAPLATGPDGETLNCNADSAAAVIAGDMRAEKFVLLTDVPGILIPGTVTGEPTLASTLSEADVEQHVRDGHISGGMVPKVKACARALDAGVRKAHIIDGRIPHALLLEIFTQSGVGTEIIGGPAAPPR